MFCLYLSCVLLHFVRLNNAWHINTCILDNNGGCGPHSFHVEKSREAHLGNFSDCVRGVSALGYKVSDTLLAKTSDNCKQIDFPEAGIAYNTFNMLPFATLTA